MAAWDVRRTKVFGLCTGTTGIEPFHQLVDLVMRQEPYRSAQLRHIAASRWGVKRYMNRDRLWNQEKEQEDKAA